MSKSTGVFGTAVVMGAMAISLIVPKAAFADVMDEWNRQSPGHSYSEKATVRQAEVTPQVRMLTTGTEPQVQVLGLRTGRTEVSSSDTSPMSQFLAQVQRESIHRVGANASPSLTSAPRQSAPYFPYLERSLRSDREPSPMDQFIGHELR